MRVNAEEKIRKVTGGRREVGDTGEWRVQKQGKREK